MSASSPHRRLPATIALVTATAFALASCASTTAETADPAGALTLKVGSILPITGAGALLGPPSIAGIDVAIDEINSAEKGITLSVEHKDSGDTSVDIASPAATELISDGVSVIIGSTWTIISKSFVDQAIAAEVVQVSPANTAPDMSTYADDGFYWRTAPSDVLQGRILGNKIVADGATTASILYLNSDYGTGLNENVTKTLEENGVTIVASESFDIGATDFTSAVDSVLAPSPEALVFIGSDEIKSVVPLLEAKGFDFSTFYGTDGSYGVIGESDAVDFSGAKFTNPGVKGSEEFETQLQDAWVAAGNTEMSVFTYGAEAYDATVLVSLAALQGGSADGVTIRDNLQSVSEGGTKCTTFAECADLIAAGEDIDYDGLSGPIEFDENGDVTEATVSIFEYGDGNVTTYLEGVSGSL